MSDLFIPGSNGKFQQKGKAEFSLRQAHRTGPNEFATDFSSAGDTNDIMAMLYAVMAQQPAIAKILLTVFYKFCLDKGISAAELKKHTFFHGS